MRTPLVYCTPQALAQGAELFPGAVVENLVEAAILAGEARFAGSEGFVRGMGWRARVRRGTPRLRSRGRPHPWIVLSVEAESRPS